MPSKAASFASAASRQRAWLVCRSELHTRPGGPETRPPDKVQRAREMFCRSGARPPAGESGRHYGRRSIAEVLTGSLLCSPVLSHHEGWRWTRGRLECRPLLPSVAALHPKHSYPGMFARGGHLEQSCTYSVVGFHHAEIQLVSKVLS